MVSRFRTHESLFSYGIARPYPFRWFTPLAVCLCITAAVLFSVVNVASSGYFLAVQATKNPNATLAENTWLQNWPSFVTSKIKPTCQSFAIPVKSELFTNNTALTYTLTDVWQDDANGTRKISSSLSYQKNLLENCSVHGIDMNFESQDRAAVQLSYSKWGVRVSAYTTCSIINSPEGPTMFNLTMSYNYVPGTVRYGEQSGFLGVGFLSRDKDKQASLYCGESLLSTTWAPVCRALQDIRQTLDSTKVADHMVTKITLNYHPHQGPTAGISDLTFFDLDYQFIRTSPNSELGPGFVVPPKDGSPVNIARLNAEKTFPNIWITADVLAKAAYPDQLEYFTANFSYSRDHVANAIPGPAEQDYATLRHSTGPLGVKPSVFVMDYICQLPKRKLLSNLIVSVFVADLVFLQATWQVCKLVVDYFFVKKIADGQWCERCKDSPEAIPLTDPVSEEDVTR